MRDQAWLENLFNSIWDDYFNDVPYDHKLVVQFGRKAKTRLGSIRLGAKGESIITVNGLFKDSQIPEIVVKATIVHELSHYAHGFNSPLSQKFRYPHAGGVMRAEFRERGLEELYVQQKRWLKDNWRQIVETNFVPRRRSSRSKVPKPFWF